MNGDVSDGAGESGFYAGTALFFNLRKCHNERYHH